MPIVDAEERLRRLEGTVAGMSSDLKMLRALLTQDHASALNKIRFVTEKALHTLCTTNQVGWGNGEPTLENMIGPLLARKIIPKNIGVHVRTIQSNASPGSHFQETPLDATHVHVAQVALVEFLEWFHTASGEAVVSDAASEKPARQLAARRRRFAVAAMLVGLVIT